MKKEADQMEEAVDYVRKLAAVEDILDDVFATARGRLDLGLSSDNPMKFIMEIVWDMHTAIMSENEFMPSRPLFRLNDKGGDDEV